MADIREELKKRILILDGAMGTSIQKHKLEEEDFRDDRLKNHSKPLKGNNDLLVFTKPELIKQIHAEFLEVGADIIETNTFSGTKIAQADYDCEDYVWEINYEGAKIAREVADEFTAKDPSKPRFVAGSIGPTNMTASISPDVNDPGYRAITFDKLVDAFEEQIEALIAGGSDVLLIETIIDTLNAKATLFACQNVFEKLGKELPIMISGTITDASGRTLSGQTTDAFLVSVSHMPLLSIGLNCALGAKDLQQYLEVLNKKSPFAVSAHPNAGLPNEFGEYDQTPEQMGDQVEEFLKGGLVNILGGCCGTGPGHIERIAELAAKYEPRAAEIQTN